MPNRTSVLAALAVAAVAVAGCAAEPQTSGQLLDRLNSGEQITAVGPRDTSLAGIARDAATAGQAGLCLRSLDKIDDKSLHDQAAEDCAARFDALGDRPTADTVVGRITDAVRRDRIRIAYAQNPAPARTASY